MEAVKLIAVVDSCHLIIYEAHGLKIIKGPDNIKLSFLHHDRPTKGHGSYDAFSGHNVSGSDPHNTPKEIDRQNAAKIICEYLDKLFEGKSGYEELILVSDPKMLGSLRGHLSKNLKKKITAEIDKDLVNENLHAVEHAVFS